MLKRYILAAVAVLSLAGPAVAQSIPSGLDLLVATPVATADGNRHVMIMYDRDSGKGGIGSKVRLMFTVESQPLYEAPARTSVPVGLDSSYTVPFTVILYGSPSQPDHVMQQCRLQLAPSCFAM